jgi:spore coat protein U-like protein
MFSIRKTSLVLSAALGLAALSTIASDALAETATDNLVVSATIANNCTISAGSIAFGAYDPIGANLGAPLDATGTVTVHCTEGSSASIRLSQGANPDTGSSTEAVPVRRLKSAENKHLEYFLFSDTERTTVWGNDETAQVGHAGDGTPTPLTVWGRIPAGQNVPAGTYNDTVIATVTF